MISASGLSRRARSTVSPWVKVNSSRLGDEGAGAALALEAQQTDDVGPLERLVEVVDDRDGPGRHVVGQQRPRRAEANLGPERGVGRDVTARDATVADVADDQDAQTVEQLGAGLEAGRAVALAQDLSNGEGVQQALGRVLVLAVAAVDHAHVRHVATDLQRRAARAVAHDDGVDAQRVDRRDGVAQRLALLHAARGDGQ